MGAKKKMLLISYHFPPSAAVGGLRTAGFAKYLPAFGWAPVVLTIRHKKDAQNWAGLPNSTDVDIHRIGPLPTVLEGYAKLKRAVAEATGADRGNPQPYEHRNFMQQSRGNFEGLTTKLKRYAFSLFFSLPDFERNWIVPAVLKGYRLIKDMGIGCILTSSPPHSVHLVGLILKKLLPVRWIADFRDPWMTPFAKGLYFTCDLSNAIERSLERKVIKEADGVLCNTQALYDIFQSEFGPASGAEFSCLTNGFDPDAFAPFQNITKYDIFTICYTGTLYLGRTPEPVFKALKELRDEKRLKPGAVKIKLVGNCRNSGGRSTMEVASAYGLGDAVEIIDQVPYSQSLEIIRKSHLALLLSSGQPYQIPAKVYDYIGSGTGILALTEEGATEKLVRGLKNGKVVNADDVNGIKNAIISFMNLANGLDRAAEIDGSPFNRKVITGSLAQALEHIIT
jgi:glycosyltransferase involved in cell wall biosynthesis